jgi:hypothetical protein
MEKKRRKKIRGGCTWSRAPWCAMAAQRHSRPWEHPAAARLGIAEMCTLQHDRQITATPCNPSCSRVGGERARSPITNRGAPSRGSSTATDIVTENGWSRQEQSGDGGGDRSVAGELGIIEEARGRKWRATEWVGLTRAGLAQPTGFHHDKWTQGQIGYFPILINQKLWQNSKN